jgi:hypothetical protein
MNEKVRTRYRIWAALAVASAALALITLLWKDWIEIVFGVDPDEGSGALEWGITLAFAALAVGTALLARHDWRRWRALT